MKIDYEWWETKEEIKTFMEENATEEQNKSNAALMSLVSFFALSKLFQLRKRIGSAGDGHVDEASFTKKQTKGEGRDDREIPPGSAGDD